MPEQRKACGAVRAGGTGGKSLDLRLFAGAGLVDEQPVGRERLDQVGREALVIGIPVGRIAEDQVVGAALGRECLEHVALHDLRPRHAQLFEIPLDRPGRLAVVLDERRGGRAAGERLEAHRPGAREEVEDGRAVDRADQVEGGLADTIGRRACVLALRREDPRAAVLSADDAHAEKLKRCGERPMRLFAEQHEAHQLDRRVGATHGRDRNGRRLLERIAVDAGGDRGERHCLRSELVGGPQ